MSIDDYGSVPLVSERSVETSPIGEPKKIKVLPAAGLFAVGYFLVCGGSYGTEALASTIPPLYALLGVIVFPVIWSLPMALTTAELGAAMPVDDGFFGWIYEGWGDLASFMDSYIISIVVTFDQALYPLIFVSYINELYPLDYWPRYGIALAFVVVCMAINLGGIQALGNSSKFFTLLTMSPFIILVIAGLASSQFNVHRAVKATNEIEGGPDINLFVSVLVWATCGYEYTGFLVPRVQNQKRTLPLVMVSIVIAMTLTYLLPVFVCLAIAEDQSMMTDGAYVRIAEVLNIRWLVWLLVVGGLLSNLGTFNAALFTSAEALRSMASSKDKLVPRAPRIFAWLPHLDPPVIGILFYSLTTGLLVLMDFEILVEIQAGMYCFHVILLSSTLAKLRWSRPTMHRPFSVGRIGAYVLPLGPISVAIFNLSTSDKLYLGLGGAAIVLGVLIYGVIYIYKRRRGANPYSSLPS